jgi:hypothetical protein
MKKQLLTDQPLISMNAKQAADNLRPVHKVNLFTELQRVGDYITFASRESNTTAFTVHFKLDRSSTDTFIETLKDDGFKVEEMAPKLLIIKW